VEPMASYMVGRGSDYSNCPCSIKALATATAAMKSEYYKEHHRGFSAVITGNECSSAQALTELRSLVPRNGAEVLSISKA
jgi:hypothetical protein